MHVVLTFPFGSCPDIEVLGWGCKGSCWIHASNPELKWKGMLNHSFFCMQHLQKKYYNHFSLMIVPDAAGELIKGTPKELTQREALRLKLKERKC